MNYPRKSIEPDPMLRHFNKKLEKFYKSCLVFNNSELEKLFMEVMKKTIVSQLLYDQYVIAISGLQGVGKSTLLKMLYDIPEDYIPEVFGVGEKIPILITEHDKNDFVCRAKRFVKVNGEYVVVDQVIERDIFKQSVMNPMAEDIFYELLVPNRYFYNSTKSFMLLPGLEHSQEAWEGLTLHALNSASTCILVFNETKFSHKDNLVLMKHIEKEFKENKPIFALTFSDQVEDHNKELKKQVVEKFLIPEGEMDRVIRTSIVPSEREIWVKKLKDSINKYAPVDNTFRKKQIEILDSFLTRDLEGILNKVEEEMLIERMNIGKGNREVETVLKKIRDQQDKIKKEYRKKLDEYLNQYKDKACKEIKEYIQEFNPQKIWINIMGPSLKAQSEFYEKIQEEWEKASSSIGYDVLPTQIISEIVYEKYPLYRKTIDNSQDKALDEAAIALHQEAVDYFDSGQVVRCLNALFNPNSDEKITPEVNNSIKYIPALALEIIRIKEVARKTGNSYNSNEIISLDMENPNFFMNALNYADNQRSNALKGIGLILGLDAVDGTVNSIPVILNALGIEVGTAAATPVVAAFGALGIAFFARNIYQQINKADFKSIDIAGRIVDLIKDDYAAIYIENFDEAMDRIYDILQEKIYIKFHLGELQSRLINIQKEMSDIRSISIEMREVIREHPCYLV